MRLTLVLTHQCNLACNYCYAGEKFRKRMEDDTAWKGLKLAFSHHDNEPLTISFFGGEPFLEFARMARWTRLARNMAKRENRPIEFSVTTNATVVSPKILRFLDHYNFRLALSVDGLGETHDRHRRFPNGRGSAELIWRNLEKFIEALPHTEILSVVSPDTVHGLLEMVQRLHQLKFASVSLLPDLAAEWNAPAREMANESYRAVANYCIASFQQEHPIWVSPFSDYLGIPSSERGCGFGIRDVAIAPSGNLYPCARLVGTDTRRDVQIGKIDQGLDMSEARALRARARAKLVGCGVDDQCGCTAVMAGDSLKQLQNLCFFKEIVQSACSAAS